MAWVHARSNIREDKRLVLILLLLIGIVVIAGGCSAKSESPDPQQQQPQAIPVEVQPLKQGTITASIEATANLIAENDVTVIARTSNRVKALYVEEGDHVKAGQLLLELEDNEQRLRLLRAQTQLDRQRAELERTRPLYEQNLISQRDYENLLYEVKTLEVSVQEAQLELEYTKVRAPIDGVITRRYVNVGDFVTTGQRLFDLVDLKSVVAPVYVPDKYLAQLRPGMKAIVRPTALPGTQLEGFVKRISPVVETQTGTVKVTIGFDDPGPLRPGMYAQVQIITAVETNAVLIPKRALLYDEDLVYVYRVDPRTMTAERVLVEVELEDRENVKPSSGFHEGDLIVVAGQTGLKPGAKVRILNQDQIQDSVLEPIQSVDSKSSSLTQNSSRAADASDRSAPWPGRTQK